jgi:hypothetical protein
MFKTTPYSHIVHSDKVRSVARRGRPSILGVEEGPDSIFKLAPCETRLPYPTFSLSHILISN